MWPARAFLVLLSVSTSGFAALTRAESRGDSAASVDADGTIESSVNSGSFEGANLIKLASAIGVDFKATLFDKISERIGTMKSSDLSGAARTLGVGQNELDLVADAEDRRAALIQLIAKGASEREEPDDEESDDDDDGAYGSDDDNEDEQDDNAKEVDHGTTDIAKVLVKSNGLIQHDGDGEEVDHGTTDSAERVLVPKYKIARRMCAMCRRDGGKRLDGFRSKCEKSSLWGSTKLALTYARRRRGHCFHPSFQDSSHKDNARTVAHPVVWKSRENGDDKRTMCQCLHIIVTGKKMDGTPVGGQCQNERCTSDAMIGRCPEVCWDFKHQLASSRYLVESMAAENSSSKGSTSDALLERAALDSSVQDQATAKHVHLDSATTGKCAG